MQEETVLGSYSRRGLQKAGRLVRPARSGRMLFMAGQVKG
jgi:hypothetical protein